MTGLRQALAGYLDLRRGLGFKLARDEKLLEQYITWLEDRGTTTVTVADALAWATLPAGASRGWLRMRITVVRGFAAYLATLDPSAEVPPASLLPGGSHRAVPYLYSAADIAALMAQATGLRTPLRPATLQTLIGLLAVTGSAYVEWLAANASAHGDAFADLVGAEGAVTAWKRDMITARSSPSTVNQALAAVTLMYEQAGLRIAVKRVRIPKPGEPDALTRQEEAALRRAAGRRGPRDSAVIAVLLDTGARVEEGARLDAEDFAVTARTGEVRLHGKGDEVRSVQLSKRARELVSAWLDVRGRHPGPVWTRQRGPLTISGITQVVLAAGDDAGIPGLRPRRCRHTFATRLRQGGADPAQVQAMLGHASIDTAARYFRSGSAENAAVIERIFGD